MSSGADRWGGARANAGRPASGPIPSEPHKPRPALSPRHPVHVVARLARDVGCARPGKSDTGRARGAGRAHRDARQAPRRTASSSRRALHSSVQRALRRSLARGDFRIVAVVVRARRLELVVEADSAIALARGMQGFQVAAARHYNRARGRSGTVFPDRYRPAALRTRAEVRDALASVGADRRLAWPATHLLRVELAPIVRLHRLADPDP